MTKVLFITGWLRSGTTIVGDALGSSPHMEHVGELHYLWDKNHPAGGECGCARLLTECPVWSPVIDGLSQRGIDRFAVNRDRLAHWRMRQLPQRLWEFRHGGVPRAYPDMLGDLYNEIAHHAGVNVVVDSTKLPGDAFASAMSKDTETFVLHMVRDPRASSYSSLRTKHHSRTGGGLAIRQHRPASTSARWLTFNALADLVVQPATIDSHYRTVRYEDFVADPHRSLRDLCDWLGEDPSQLPLAGERAITIGTTHTVMGNPNRFHTGPVELKPDDEWKSQFVGVPRAASTLVSAPLLHRYRYDVAVGGGRAT